MNTLKSLIKNSIFAIAICSTFGAFAQEKPGDITKVNNEAYMLVRHFTTPQQNDEFQKNLAIMQRDARAIALIKAKIEKTADENEKADLEGKLKQIEDAFKTNDETMRRAFGFASNRTYKFVFLKSGISIPLTKEELSSLKSDSGEELDLLKIVEKNGTSLYRQTVVDGVKENEELRKMIGFTLARKNDIAQIRKEISQTTEPDKQMELSTKLVAAEKALKENDAVIREKYGIKDGRNYVVEIEDSKLYLLLTPEELEKAELEAAAKKAASK